MTTIQKGQTELLLPALRLAVNDCGLTKRFSLTTAMRGGGRPPGTTVAHDGNSFLQLIVERKYRLARAVPTFQLRAA